MTTSFQEVLALVKSHNVEMVDFKFVDLLGNWQHYTIPSSILDEKIFEEGLGFDGSSIKGFKTISESDMLLFPDSATAIIDPFCDVITLSMICNVYEPLTGERYTRDPRNIAQKAEKFLLEVGIADISYWGPEAEFFILDSVSFDQNQHSGFYFIDSEEGAWNSGRIEGGANLGHRPRYREGCSPVSPIDSQYNLRSEMALTMQKCGIDVEAHLHEVATAGQAEINMRYTSLTKMADQLMLLKYIVKNTAAKHGKTATFMPKPIFMDNGSGMHVHQSLWREGQPLFYDPKGYAGLSEMALYYIGGILKHGPALTALCNPTTNSFKRLVPGFEAPTTLVYSMGNRSAAVRIPMYSQKSQAKRIEVRFPDSAANPYIAFSAMLMAGIDGILNKILPGKSMEKDLYDVSPREEARIRSLPISLEAALRALRTDHEFLLKGGVFDSDFINNWIDYKMRMEVDALKKRPHPYEFTLYYDC